MAIRASQKITRKMRRKDGKAKYLLSSGILQQTVYVQETRNITEKKYRKISQIL